MQVIIVCVVVAILLFGAAFVTKRRFGLLGLALATGSILSTTWGYNIGIAASIAGVPSGASTSALLLGAMTLLPACILLFHGYTYRTFIGRVFGAAMFTLLALAFLIEPIGHILVLNGLGLTAYNLLDSNRDFIIGIGLVIAVIDLFLTKPAKTHEKSREH